MASDINREIGLAAAILSEKVGRRVVPGEVVECDVDVALTHDVLGPPTFREFAKLGVPVWNPDRVFLAIDHFVPAANTAQAANNAFLTEVAERHGIVNRAFYDGPSHQTLLESGLVQPGSVVVGTDSHTCTAGVLGSFATGIGTTEMVSVLALGRLWLKVPESVRVRLQGRLPDGVYAKDVVLSLLARFGTSEFTYRSLEFDGEGVEAMSLDERTVFSNMAVELGAKVGLFSSPELDGFVRRWGAVPTESGVGVIDQVDIDLSEQVPMCAVPHNPANSKPIEEVEPVAVQQAFIGSCTGGRYDDFVQAARILNGRRVSDKTRLIVVPASRRVYQRMALDGLLNVFVNAGAIVQSPSCGPCAGLQNGVLGDGEVSISASNRNFQGRMGNPAASVYLASPAAVAAAAVAGRIVDPREFLETR
ncbi:MAG: 3-isopropylmalate dehydratase, LeuD subunit [Nocardia sp.]|uniref:3-isopropylmalate dehydratase/homoaconitate hydratase family large subunit n=1 Tax=Nocardia sp. TaxID=1821 RepID=UPI00260F8024|nr:3-isopropylmalate dehydratase/homoaconitate hydratase family large subunit [Nocardia sp.]MCU1644930.1 3-isopropylmalate dehydratase, LeuD subunit [Nocardia sp.]